MPVQNQSNQSTATVSDQVKDLEDQLRKATVESDDNRNAIMAIPWVIDLVVENESLEEDNETLKTKLDKGEGENRSLASDLLEVSQHLRVAGDWIKTRPGRKPASL